MREEIRKQDKTSLPKELLAFSHLLTKTLALTVLAT